MSGALGGDSFIRVGPVFSPPACGRGRGWAEQHAMPAWKSRNTARARTLRNAATPAERILWRYLSRAQLGVRFSRQMPLGPYFADFLCRELQLVVELDGFSHELSPGRDAARDAWMVGQGYRVLRFGNADVAGNVEGVVAAIRAAVGELQAACPANSPPGCG